MKGKLIFILPVILGIAIPGFIFFRQRQDKEITPIANTQKTQTSKSAKKPVKLETYEDPAGFTFKYPENLTIKTNKASDQSVFSSLTLTSKEFSGKIDITVISSNVTNLAQYITQNKLVASNESKLADIEAISYEKNGKYITTAVDVGSLLTFTVDYQKNKKYWMDINNTILKSFEFSIPEETSAGSTESYSGGEDLIFEGEEIIE